MVLVPQHPISETREVDVVLGVWRGQDDGSGTSKLEDHALESVESRRVEMLDDFDERGRVEARNALVPVKQAAVQERDA